MPRKRTTLELDEDLIDWCKNTFPEVSLWAITNGLLRAYKEVVEESPPKNYYLLGARRLKEQIEHDLKSFETKE